MTSITRMNKKRGEARQARIDLVESRRSHKKSPVMAAIEYNRKKAGTFVPTEPRQKKEDQKSNGNGQQQPKYVKDLHSETMMKNLNSEMSSVKDVLSDFTSAVERTRASEKLGEKSTESSEKLTGQEFSFSRKKQIVGLDKQTLDTIRKIVQEELTNAGGSGGGMGLGGFLPGGKGKGPTGTVPPTGTKSPTPIIPVGAQKARPAFNRAGRLGAIFRRTAETKGFGQAVRKTAGLAMPSSRAIGAAGKAILPASLIAIGITAWNANDQLIQVGELEKDGRITPEQAEQARKEIKASAGGSVVGTVAGGAAGVVAGRVAGRLIGGGIGTFLGGPVGAAVLGTAGGVAGGYLAEKAAKYLTREEPPKAKESVNLGTGDGSSTGSADATAAINAVSKEFDIPRDEMLSTAQKESGLNPKAMNQTGSSAAGLYQFIPSTWDKLLEKYPEVASKYSINKTTSGRDDRLDAYKAAVMYAVLRNDNKSILGNLTTGISEVDTYLTHLLGAPVAKTFIKAYTVTPNAIVTSIPQIGIATRVYNQNLGVFSSNGNPRTLQQVVDYIKNWNKSALASAKKKTGESGTTPSKKSSSFFGGIFGVIEPGQANPQSTSGNTTAVPRGSVSSSNPKQEVAPTITPTKISMTEQRIQETADASKVEKERNKPAPIVINAPTTVQQSAPQAKVDYDPRAALSTRNDNPYLNIIKTQELSRMK